jgi:geranylgeranyl pyrophosphate synthase
MSTVIEHLVKGEIMQMRPSNNSTQTALNYYLRKNFYKTASLMGNSCLSAAVLGISLVLFMLYHYFLHLDIQEDIQKINSVRATCMELMLDKHFSLSMML